MPPSRQSLHQKSVKPQPWDRCWYGLRAQHDTQGTKELAQIGPENTSLAKGTRHISTKARHIPHKFTRMRLFTRLQ